MQRWIPHTFARDIPPIIASTPYERKGHIPPPTNATEMNTIMFIILQQDRDNGGLKERITGV